MELVELNLRQQNSTHFRFIQKVIHCRMQISKFDTFYVTHKTSIQSKAVFGDNRNNISFNFKLKTISMSTHTETNITIGKCVADDNESEAVEKS